MRSKLPCWNQILLAALGVGMFLVSASVSLAQDGAAPADSPVDLTAEFAESEQAASESREAAPEAEQLLKEFEQARAAMAEAIAELRGIQLRYRNGVDQSPEAVRAYRETRDRARELLNEAYTLGLQAIRQVPDRDVATFLLTLTQVHQQTDIYDEETCEVASRLIDGGVNQAFLFKSAARSGMVSGHFKTAKIIYDALKDEQLEDCDYAMIDQFDLIKDQYEKEMEYRKQDAEDELPRVRLKTTRGDIVVELFLNQAPSTVSHFIKLVEDGFYNESDFYQVKDHTFALGGDPNGDGSGNSGQFLADEHDRPDARPALRGTLLMAKIPVGPGEFAPNTGSSQFSILFLPVPQVTDELTAFGRVIEGMDVASQLRRVDPFEETKKNEIVLPPDRILSADVIRRPEKLPQPEYVEPGSETSAVNFP